MDGKLRGEIKNMNHDWLEINGKMYPVEDVIFIASPLKELKNTRITDEIERISRRENNINYAIFFAGILFMFLLLEVLI